MMKKVIRSLLIALCVLVVVFVIPIIINELFKIDDGYIVLWNADDVLNFYGAILSFIGATILGIIALYQNKKFQMENDKAQKSLENINKHISDNIFISDIVKHETQRVDSLQKLLNEYETVSNLQNIGIELLKTDDLAVNIANIEHKIDILSTELIQEFKRDQELFKNNKHPLKAAFYQLNKSTKKIFKNFRNKDISALKQGTISEYVQTWTKFVEEKQKYLISQRQKIDNALYGNFSIEEVKRIFINRIDKI